ncbi:MAG: N-acetylglucosamine-6-phosphate deacetylase [Treponemataceae bacterium]|nr:MAG: N-acetylglucosamine-6-phosphate deacetylase [Treponemataceae bacterium]
MSICIHNATVINGFSEMENCAMLISKQDGKIEDIFTQKRYEQKLAQKFFPADTEFLDVKGAYIATGLIDTHIHGYGGYGTEDCSTDSILAMSELLAERGVTAFNPTLYPSDEENMLKTIKAVVSAMGNEKGAKIMGLHLEGPFLSTEKIGVQRPETIKQVDLDLLDRLWNASGGHIVNMTVAPEIKHMRDLALSAIKKGIVLQAGHTNALYINMEEGMQAGILHSTHLFNAMSQMHHRDPGAVGAVLIQSQMSCEIIADGIHVHPDLFKLLMRDKPIDKIVLVTDGLKPTEQKNGALFANGEEVVMQDGCFHRKLDGVIAGSSLTMIRGVKNMVKYGFSLVDAVRCAACNPAQVMRYTTKGQLLPGYDADIIAFDDNFDIKLSIVGGSIKKCAV